MSLPPLLHRHFDERAAQSPDRIALREGAGSTRYGELLAWSMSITRTLRRRGIGGGDRVGVHMDRSTAWVSAVLGVLRAGAAVVPMPPSYPRERLRATRSFCSLDLVLDRPDTPYGDDPGAAVLGLDRMQLERDPTAGEEPEDVPTLDGDAPAFILSSSGSTGHPKMIVRSHRSFFHRLTWTWATHPLSDEELGCQKAHMTTTHSLYELFEPLLAGAPTLIVPDREARNIAGFWKTLRSRGVTRLLIVPSALRASLDMPGFEAPGALKVVVLMGEYVAPGLAERAVEAFPERTALYSIYGSTEASSSLVVDLRESLVPGEELPLGVPITPDVTALVLDEELRPVPPREVGRLHIGGTPLFNEYLNDPEMTASVTVEAPSSASRQRRLYDTRDQVRRTVDGKLHFVGRVDHTVKVRGYRIDLPEVERAIRRHPEVTQAAVVVTGEGTSSVGLAGFYVPSGVPEGEVYEVVRGLLPDYMVPSVLVGLDAFPLTPSAKIDRGRLLEEKLAEPETSQFSRDLSATEERVAEAWAAVLGHHRFDLDSSFFEVGGTSLTVFALAHRLRETLGLDRDQLQEESIYRVPTLQGLADLIDRLRSGEDVSEPAQRTPILVTLRTPAAGCEEEPPLIVVPSAGGTLGAYELLAKALPGGRGVVGLRDPYLWGERELTEGFQSWIDRYLEAIRQHQPVGPYVICAYSSAGAFGYEIARRLQREGEEVELLALVDPLALDRSSRWRFGYWALRATWMRPSLRRIVQLAGRVRSPAVRALDSVRGQAPNDFALSGSALEDLSIGIRRNKNHLMNVATLFELNSGLPFALTDDDFAGVPPDRFIEVFVQHVQSITPEVEPESIRRIVLQYEVQVKAQHAYTLQRFDGPVLLCEPRSRYSGLLPELLRPHVRDLDARAIPLGEADDRTQLITRRFGAIRPHYRSMRDPVFVEGLAKALTSALEGS